MAFLDSYVQLPVRVTISHLEDTVDEETGAEAFLEVMHDVDTEEYVKTFDIQGFGKDPLEDPEINSRTMLYMRDGREVKVLMNLDMFIKYMNKVSGPRTD